MDNPIILLSNHALPAIACSKYIKLQLLNETERNKTADSTNLIVLEQNKVQQTHFRKIE